MRALEAVLAALVVAGLTYFAYSAVGDDFPVNLAVAALGFVVAAALVTSVWGGRSRR